MDGGIFSVSHAQEPIVKETGILFVCTGNICRSPTAEAVFRKLATDADCRHRFRVGSAGTQDYHVGEAPDSRSQRAARQHGIDMSMQRARQVCADDYFQFDYLVAMDRSHYQYLLQHSPVSAQARIVLLLDSCQADTGRQQREHASIDWAALRGNVPDPYYGVAADFDRCYTIIATATQALLLSLLSA